MDHLEFVSSEQVPLHADIDKIDPRCFEFDSFHKGGAGFELSKDGLLKPVFNETNSPYEKSSGFVQRWLFFGLLLELLSGCGNFRIDTYYTRGQYRNNEIQGSVNTSSLEEDIRSWEAYELHNPEGRKARLIHKQYVLNRARYYIHTFCSVNSNYLFPKYAADKQGPRWPKTAVNERIVLSIMAVGQTLSKAMARIQKLSGFNLKEWQSHDEKNEGWGYSALIVDELKAKHWCPHAIHNFFVLFRGNSLGLYYISRVVNSPGPFAEPHTSCASAPKCQTQETAGPNILTHSPECRDRGSDQCTKRLAPKQSSLLEALREGKVPLLQYCPDASDDEEKVQIKKMDPSFNLDYGVFSHVWAHQLGDPAGTASKVDASQTSPKTTQTGQADLETEQPKANIKRMHECVLKWLVEMFETIGSPKPCLFWIDTLCIPSANDDESRELRSQEIQKMHHVYTHAANTVVIDAGLVHRVTQDKFIKMAPNFIVCQWAARLWTLQEAVLSQNIWFQLNDGPYPLSALEKEFKRHERTSASCVPATVRVYYHNMLGDERSRIHEHESPDWKPNAAFIGRIWKAAQWRSTAWPQDETLALAILLNLPTAEFDDRKGGEWTDDKLEKRMTTLLRLLAKADPCAIPPGIIFHSGERLSAPGFRWAPRTWMQPSQVDSPDPITIAGPPSRLIRFLGLEVQFPGFLLHDLSGDMDARKNCRRFVFSPDITLTEWYAVTKANVSAKGKGDDCIFDKNSLKNSEEEQQFAIIMPQYPLVHKKEIALLVYVKEDHGPLLYVTIVNRIWVERGVPQEDLEKKQLDFRQKRWPVFSCGERLSASQRWCVDGPLERSRPVAGPRAHTALEPRVAMEIGQRTRTLMESVKDGLPWTGTWMERATDRFPGI